MITPLICDPAAVALTPGSGAPPPRTSSRPNPLGPDLRIVAALGGDDQPADPIPTVTTTA